MQDMTSLITVDNAVSPARFYLNGLAGNGSVVQQTALETIARLLSDNTLGYREFPWHTLGYAETRAIMAALQKKYAPATVNRMFSAVRGVLKECHKLGMMTHDEYLRAIDVKPIKGNALPLEDKGRHLSHGEVSALMEACIGDLSNIGQRNAAMLAVALSTGLRRAEMCNLRTEDIDLKEKVLIVQMGKGGGKRLMPLADVAVDALTDWLALRQAQGPAGEPVEPGGWLFTAVRKSGEVTTNKLDYYSFQQIMAKIAEFANVPNFKPHDLRRTFAGNLLDAGVDISTVQKLMGHSSPVSTAHYDRRPSRVRREAVNRLYIPYRRAK